GAPVSVDVAAPARPVAGGTETILVIEDQEELRRFVSDILGRHGYRVLEAPTPTEAIALASREGELIDLLVTDVVMPDMSGPETARLLRERQRTMPILYMTGYPREALDSNAPAGDLLQKPFTSADLLRRIRTLLDGTV